MTDTTTTDIAALPPADRALIVLNSTKTEADLLAMVEEAATITEIKDKAGREQAHRVGMKLRSARTTIQKTGKSARDDATAFCNAVIREEKRLIAITEGEEKRVIGLRDAFDEQLEAERRAAEEAEAKRVADIKEKIAGIRNLPLALAGANSDEIMMELAAIDQFEPPQDVFGEFTGECVAAIEECVATLKDMHAKVMAQETAMVAQEEARRRAEEELAAERAAIEAERAALAAERAELERLRAAAKPAVITDEATIADASADLAGAETEPLAVTMATTEGDEPTPIEPEPIDLGDIGEPAAPTDWRIRNFAMFTAAQFDALAAKVNQCGFTAFADNLRGVGAALRQGEHDAALARADHEALIAADNLLMDATVEAIDALQEMKVAA